MSEVDPRWSELLEAARCAVEDPFLSCLSSMKSLRGAVRAFDPPKPSRTIRKGGWFCAEDDSGVVSLAHCTWTGYERTILRPVGLEAGDE